GPRSTAGPGNPPRHSPRTRPCGPSSSSPWTRRTPRSRARRASRSSPCCPTTSPRPPASSPPPSRSSGTWWRSATRSRSRPCNPSHTTRPAARHCRGGVPAGRGCERLRGVELLAVGREPVVHHVALELECRGELAALARELVGEDRELPDRLGAGDRPVGAVDGVLNRGHEVTVLQQVGDLAGLAVLVPPRREGLLVDGDQGGDET